MMLTPKGLAVSFRVAHISDSSSSGDIDPVARIPNPPALEIAATSVCSETQLIAPPQMA